jgi:hypothetical protein
LPNGFQEIDQGRGVALDGLDRISNRPLDDLPEDAHRLLQLLYSLVMVLVLAGYLLVLAAWRVHVVLSWRKRRRSRIPSAQK